MNTTVLRLGRAQEMQRIYSTGWAGARLMRNTTPPTKVLWITNLELSMSNLTQGRNICYVSVTGAAWLSHESTRSATCISPKSGEQTQAECATSTPTISVTTGTSFPPPLSSARSAASICSRASRRRGRRKDVNLQDDHDVISGHLAALTIRYCMHYSYQNTVPLLCFV